MYIPSFPRAKEALSLLLLPRKDGDNDSSPMRAIDAFDLLEIYPGNASRISTFCRKLMPWPIIFSGSKLQHFKKLHHDTGIPYSEMVRLHSLSVHSFICV